MSGIATIDEIFEEMERNFRAEKAEGLDETYVFNITGPTGGIWNVRISDGQCEFNRGETDNPSVTVSASASDWADMYNGVTSPQQAYMSGKLKVQGDLGLATLIESLFF